MGVDNAAELDCNQERMGENSCIPESHLLLRTAAQMPAALLRRGMNALRSVAHLEASSHAADGHVRAVSHNHTHGTITPTKVTSNQDTFPSSPHLGTYMHTKNKQSQSQNENTCLPASKVSTSQSTRPSPIHLPANPVKWSPTKPAALISEADIPGRWHAQRLARGVGWRTCSQPAGGLRCALRFAACDQACCCAWLGPPPPHSVTAARTHARGISKIPSGMGWKAIVVAGRQAGRQWKWKWKWKWQGAVSGGW
jgi:hypothetical protein